MDVQVKDKIDEIMKSISGDDFETVSFVSDKNKNVSSVQFVIKTSTIEKPQVEESNNVQEEHLSFWQKLLKLFGLN